MGRYGARPASAKALRQRRGWRRPSDQVWARAVLTLGSPNQWEVSLTLPAGLPQPPETQLPSSSWGSQVSPQSPCRMVPLSLSMPFQGSHALTEQLHDLGPCSHIPFPTFLLLPLHTLATLDTHRHAVLSSPRTSAQAVRLPPLHQSLPCF